MLFVFLFLTYFTLYKQALGSFISLGLTQIHSFLSLSSIPLGCVCACEEVHVCVRSCFSHVQLFVTLWTVARQAPLSMGSSGQEHWSGLPFPSPGDLPNPGIEPWSPALQADALTSEPQCWIAGAISFFIIF